MSESGERRTASGAWPSILPKLSASARVACGASVSMRVKIVWLIAMALPSRPMARRLLAREARLGAEALVGQLAHLGERDVARPARPADDVELVGVPGREAEEAAAVPAQEEGRVRPLHGLREEHRILKAVELACEAERLAAPQPPDAGERLVEHAQPSGHVRERDARHAEL